LSRRAGVIPWNTFLTIVSSDSFGLEEVFRGTNLRFGRVLKGSLAPGELGVSGRIYSFRSPNGFLRSLGVYSKETVRHT